MNRTAQSSRTWIRVFTGMVLAVVGSGVIMNLGGCRGCAPTAPPNPLDDSYKAKVKTPPPPTPEAILRSDNDQTAARRLAALIDGGADPNGGEEAKRTGPPLISAARMAKPASVQTLIAKGADVNAKGRQGTTALHEAALGGSKEVVEDLIKAGAKIDTQDNFGQAPIHQAIRGSKPEIVEMLIAKGANVNARTKHGTTPIYEAYNQSNYELIELLVKHGADIDAECQGMTPLASSILQEEHEMEAFLRRLGAKKAVAPGKRAVNPALVDAPRR